MQSYWLSKLAFKKKSRPFGFEATFLVSLYSESLLLKRPRFESWSLQTLRAYNFAADWPARSKTSFYESPDLFIKSEEEKTRHFLGFIAHQIFILVVKCIKQGQNKMFKASILGIVRFCRSNITLDMIKKLKNCFFKNCIFLLLFRKKCKNWHFLKKQFFSLLIISQVILV